MRRDLLPAHILKNYPFLFLDRDGVINRRLIDDYVKTPDEFIFEPGVIDSFPWLSASFSRILIVTNQRGIGVGIMTEEDLQAVHQKMQNTLNQAGAQVDGIYHAPYDRDETHFRKPGTGMALQAQQDFPEIDFERSLMVGDSLSDMEMGRRAGMLCVKIGPSHERGDWDLHFPSLQAFAHYLQKG